MAYIVQQRKRRRRVVRRRGLGDVAPKGGMVLTSPVRLGVPCDSTGQFTLQNGKWRRLTASETCSNTSAGTPGHTGSGGGGGVTVVETVCAQPPSGGGLVVDLTSPGIIDYGDNPPTAVPIVLSATEGEGVEYAFFCLDPTVIALNRAQRQEVVYALTGMSTAHGHDYPWQAITDSDRVDAGSVAYGYAGRWWKDVVAGQSPIAEFVGTDGDTKNVYVTITGDPRNPKATFRWAHRPTAFQTIDNFLSSLSPISTDQLCQMLPITSKVPNPYVMGGSILLQMSGKCPPSCPSGMLYDAKAKTCSCPPGSQFNIALNRCEVGHGSQNWIKTAVIGGGVLLAILAITSGGGSRTKARG